MVVAGIVAEFNPFHNGHALLCREARRRGATHLVAVMSGNFVQRGDAAIAEKRVRAACALAGGVDLVLELPVAWAAATAQVFARGAVGVLAACGCVDALCFGSESGDASLLERLGRAVEDEGVEMLLRLFLAQGMTFARARQRAVEETLGAELSDRMARPNDALGIEYLRQARALGWEPSLMVVPRRGAAHDGPPRHRVASASWLRERADRLPLLGQYMPPACGDLLAAAAGEGLFPARLDRLETAILAKLRALEPRELARLPDLSEGLENRLEQAIRRAISLEELALTLKTKRYTMARVRRLILAAFLGLRREDSRESPPYLRILGFNRRGREVLGRMDTALPCDTSLARLSRQGERCEAVARLESAVTDLYTLALPRPRPCGYDLTATGSWLVP